MIAIINYGMGNTFSVYNALDYLGIDSIITNNIKEIQNSNRIILPGVGAFSKCMDNLKKMGLDQLLYEEVIVKGKPFFGICLGMQILADIGTEKGLTKGLGFISGEVQKLKPNDSSLKIPHVGWNDIIINKETPLFKGLKKDKAFYFTHSYFFAPKNKKNIVAQCNYSGLFTCAVIKDNIFATQFHPEKSQKNGLILLENFANWRV